jgi:hypothetical protein
VPNVGPKGRTSMGKPAARHEIEISLHIHTWPQVTSTSGKQHLVSH